MITSVNTMKWVKVSAARFVPNIRQRVAENRPIDDRAGSIIGRD